jgi:hypothetical protein
MRQRSARQPRARLSGSNRSTSAFRTWLLSHARLGRDWSP